MVAIQRKLAQQLLREGYKPADVLKMAGVSLQTVVDKAGVSYTLVHQQVHEDFITTSRGEGINAVRKAINTLLGFQLWTFKKARGVVTSSPSKLLDRAGLASTAE